MHYALLHTQTAKHHGYNEFVHCCMPRPQSIVFHIASMANTQMSLSHSRNLQCYLKIRYIHGALRSGYATIRNAQCNNWEDNLFWIRCIHLFAKILLLKYIYHVYTPFVFPWKTWWQLWDPLQRVGERFLIKECYQFWKDIGCFYTGAWILLSYVWA